MHMHMRMRMHMRMHMCTCTCNMHMQHAHAHAHAHACIVRLDTVQCKSYCWNDSGCCGGVILNVGDDRVRHQWALGMQLPNSTCVRD